MNNINIINDCYINIILWTIKLIIRGIVWNNNKSLCKRIIILLIIIRQTIMIRQICALVLVVLHDIVHYLDVSTS